MSVLERIRRKYSKTTPEDDGDELDLERYRPTSRLEDKYQRLVSKNQEFIEETVGSRRASKVEDLTQTSRASRQSSILEDTTPSSRRTSKIEDISPKRSSKIDDGDDDQETLSNIRSRRTSQLKEEDLAQPARGKLDKQSFVIEETRLTARRSSKIDDLTQVPSKGQLEEDDSTTVETSSRRTSYSRRSTSKDESLETINPEDVTEGNTSPANKFGVTDLRRRSSKLENIPDDEVLEILKKNNKPSRGKLDKDDLEGEGDLPSRGTSRRTSKSSTIDDTDTPKNNLSRQTSKNDQETPKNLSRQSSNVESVEEVSQKGKSSRLNSRTSTAEFSRQTSEMKDVEEKHSAENTGIGDVEGSQKSRTSRLSSWTSVDDLSESTTTTPKNLSRQTSMSRQTSTVESFEETAKLSRRSSKIESVEEISKLSRRSSQISNAIKTDLSDVDTPKNLSGSGVES
ncbi:hypothetical protein WDU94_000502 [Cyamophila willieti]